MQTVETSKVKWVYRHSILKLRYWKLSQPKFRMVTTVMIKMVVMLECHRMVGGAKSRKGESRVQAAALVLAMGCGSHPQSAKGIPAGEHNYNGSVSHPPPG